MKEEEKYRDTRTGGVLNCLPASRKPVVVYCHCGFVASASDADGAAAALADHLDAHGRHLDA